MSIEAPNRSPVVATVEIENERGGPTPRQAAFMPIRGYRDLSRYPSTEHQLRHIYRNINTNGLGDAFRRVNGRILVDPDRLQRLIAAPDGASSNRS